VGRTETKIILVRAGALRTTVISPTGGNAAQAFPERRITVTVLLVLALGGQETTFAGTHASFETSTSVRVSTYSLTGGVH